MVKLLQSFGLCFGMLEKTSNKISINSIEKQETNLEKQSSESMAESLLPLDLILEILCRLPVKPLLRFKSVCKLWRSAIQDWHFVHKYKIHNGWMNPRFLENASEVYYCSDGLILEGSTLEGSTIRDKLFLWNPATGQKVKLPDPHKGAKHIKFSYIRAIKTYKLVHVHSKEGLENGGCKVLTIGTDPTWRSIDIPGLYSLGSPQEKCCTSIVNKVLFFSIFRTVDSGVPELIYLDLASEKFGNIQAPPVIFGNRERVSLTIWENKFALAYHVDQVIHFWILEDFEKQKWAEKTITPFSSLLAKYPDLPATWSPHFVYKGVMEINLSNGYHITYCLASKKVCATAPPPGKEAVSFGYINIGRIPESEVADIKV